MTPPNEEISKLVELIETVFPKKPVPRYPKKMGWSMGVDEYEPFAHSTWTYIDPCLLAGPGGPTWYDISPTTGFRLHSSPTMWNYFVPAFMRAALLHDEEHGILHSFLHAFRRVSPLTWTTAASEPWWAGQTHFENYSLEQARTVVQFLEWAKTSAPERQWGVKWEPLDQRCLEQWMQRVQEQSGQEKDGDGVA